MYSKYKKKLIAIGTALTVLSQCVVINAINTNDKQSINDKSHFRYSGEQIVEITTSSMIQLNDITTSSAINLIINPTFDQIESTNQEELWKIGKKAIGWEAVKWSNLSAAPKFSIEKIEDNSVLKMEIEDNSKTRGYLKQTISVKPNTTYELEVDIKLQEVEGNKFAVYTKELGTDPLEVTYYTEESITTDWKTIKHVFTTSDKVNELQVEFRAGGKAPLTSGIIWLDNVSLKQVEESNVLVDTISVDPMTIIDAPNTTHQITATVLPEEASDKSLKWECSDTDIATVNESGEVHLIAPGQAVVTAFTMDGSDKVAISNVTVIEESKSLINNPGFELEEQDVHEEGKKSLWMNDIKPISWNARGWNGYETPQFSLEQINGSKALKINLFKANGRGIVSQRVNVKPNTNYEFEAYVKLDNVIGNNLGIQTKQLRADGTAINGSNYMMNIIGGTKEWSKLTGKVYTTSETGQLEIAFLAGATNALSTGTIWIDNTHLEEAFVPVEKLEINQDNIYDMKGTAHQLQVKILPTNASNQTIQWNSSNEDVVKVDNQGNLVLEDVGIATITATTFDGKKEVKCEVTVVEDIEITQINIDDEIYLDLGNTVKIIPEVFPPGIKPKNLKWESSNIDCVEVNQEGIVSSKAEGSSVIRVSSEDGKVYDECDITVGPRINNLIDNGGFEEVDDKNPNLPANYSYWTPTGKATVELDQNTVYRGTNSLKIFTEENTRTSISTPNILIEPGNYRLSVRVNGKNVVADNGLMFRYNIFNKDGSKISRYSSGTKNTNGWQEKSIVFTAPQEAKEVKVEIFFETGTGSIWLDELRLEKWAPIESIDIEDEVTLDLDKGQDEYTLMPNIMPSDASDKQVIWGTSNEKIVAVTEGKLKGLRQGEATITVMTPDKQIKDVCKVKVIGQGEVIPVEELIISQGSINIVRGTSEKLQVSIRPENATHDMLMWSSEDERIATVIDGRIQGINIGTTKIKAISHNKKTVECIVNVIPDTWSQYTTLKNNWKSNLIDAKNQIISEEEIQSLWTKMYTNEERLYIWGDLADYNKSTDIRDTLGRLKNMALSTVMEGSSYNGNLELINDIVEATVWIYENTYSEEHLNKYNWWDWDIGIPHAFNDIVALLYEYFTPGEVANIMEYIHNTIMPDPLYSRAATGVTTENSGANVVDQVKTALMPAIILKDHEKIDLCIERMFMTMEYVQSEDGFYIDGSFIQHGKVAYTGSYGAVWLQGIASIATILEGTDYELKNKEGIQVLYDIIRDSFIPIIYKGAAMDMVRGRAIAKSNNDDHNSGHGIINSIVTISKSASEEYKKEILPICKYWVIQDNCEEAAAFKNMQSELLEDESIIPINSFIMSKEFLAMNRSVHHRETFSYGISKSSKTVQNYELTNGQNQKGWYTGDGMAYLYNNDFDQFDDMFWITADYYRLPGTTVDRMIRTWGDYQNGDGEGMPQNTWAGGVTFNNLYGASGMNLQPVKTGLQANKSWFIFDDEIVALGSDIKSQSGNMVETTIEQRKIEGSNIFMVDGEMKLKSLGDEESLQDVRWAYLEGEERDSNIGYYFPDTLNLKVKKETRTGNYNEINLNQDYTMYTRNYLTMWMEHGMNPLGEKYSYSILPGKLAEEVKGYAENPDITILSNTREVHAVKENTLNMIAANFFDEGTHTVEDITVNKQASIIMQEGAGYLEIAISDPTMSNKGVIEVEIAREGNEELLNNPYINVTQLAPTIKFDVLVGEAIKGQTVHAKFSLSGYTPVQGITLNQTELKLKQGQKHKLIAKVLPQNASNAKIKWESTNPEVVSIIEEVDNIVTIKANKRGKATLRVTTLEGEKEALCEIVVNKNVDYDYDYEEESIEIDTDSKEKVLIEKVNSLSREEKQEFIECIVEGIPYTILKGGGIDSIYAANIPQSVLEIINRDLTILEKIGINVKEYITDIELSINNKWDYLDIDESHWAYSGIKDMTQKGIIKGYPEGKFMPNQNIRVEDTFVFLDRILLSNKIEHMKLGRGIVEMYITDKQHWAFKHMASIGSKLSEQTLKRVKALGEASISRELLAQVIYEITEGKLVQVNEGDTFDDMSISNYQNALEYCVTRGILKGISDTQIAPLESVTRAQMAVVLMRLEGVLNND